MALSADNKKLFELIVDIVATAAIADLVWTRLFGQPAPIKELESFIAVLATGAIGWLAWKHMRTHPALK